MMIIKANKLLIIAYYPILLILIPIIYIYKIGIFMTLYGYVSSALGILARNHL